MNDKPLMLDTEGGYAPVTVEEDGHKMVVSHRTGAGFGVGTFISDDGEEETEEINIYVLGLRCADDSEHEFIFAEEEIIQVALEIVEWQLNKVDGEASDRPD